MPVGKIIALLAEEGDDISNLQPPKEENRTPKQAATSSSPPPPEPPTPAEIAVPSLPSQLYPSTPLFHSRPLFPSVYRLLQEFGVKEPQSIKGTGVRGMLTKGDVLTYLGKASGPLGTYKESPTPHPSAPMVEKKEEYKVRRRFTDSHNAIPLTLTA